MTRRVYECEVYAGEMSFTKGDLYGFGRAKNPGRTPVGDILACFYEGQRVRITIEPISTDHPDPEPCPHPKKLWTD